MTLRTRFSNRAPRRLAPLAVVLALLGGAASAQSRDALDAGAAPYASLPMPFAEPLAGDPTPQPRPFADRRDAVGADTLARMRGGFSAGGLTVSFGIERAVYVNGALVATTSLNVAEAALAGTRPLATALDAGTLTLIQSGAGNAVASATLASATAGTIVQNTLNGQTIQNVTTINATANSLGMLRGLNLSASLRGAVIDSLRR